MDFTQIKEINGLRGPILITGHTGFKGTWLTLLLEYLEIECVGFSLQPEFNSLFDRAGRKGALPEFFEDIRDFAKVEEMLKIYRPTAVIHMAAQPLVLDSYKAPRQTFETNVMGTANILDASFETQSVEAVIVVTTDKVYKNQEIGKRFIESDALSGKDPYSASKVGTESAVSAWQHISNVSGGPKVVSVRAGNVIGGGDWAQARLLPDLIRGFESKNRIEIRNPESTRPWQHVLDPLMGYLKVLNAVLGGKNAEAFNFGPSGESLTVRDVAELASTTWGHTAGIDYVQNPLEQYHESVNLSLDSSQARDYLNWDSKWSQAESVVATVEWWKSVLQKRETPIQACLNDIGTMMQFRTK